MKRILFVLVFCLLGFGGASYAASPVVASDVILTSSNVTSGTLALPELDLSLDSRVVYFWSCCRSGVVITPAGNRIITVCADTCEEAEKELNRLLTCIAID